MTVSALLPVYNERDTIEELVERLVAVAVVTEIIAVDDSSTDGTSEILASLVERHGPRLKLITHPDNQGKGAAVRSALAAASGSHVIVQDGDLEYAPEEIGSLAACVAEGGSEAIYGSRLLELRYSHFPLATHFLGNWALTAVCNVASRGRLNLTDMATCYKLVSRERMLSLNLQENGFGFDPEVTLKLAQLGTEIREVPVSYSGRDRRSGKKIRWADGILYLRCMWRYRVRRVRSSSSVW